MTLNEEIKPLKIFIGWDSREDIAYQVAKHSIEKHSSVPVEIIPIKQKLLRKEGMYTRPIDALASTEFTFTRFLIPEIMEFDGWALFIDCDFVALTDIADLFAQANDQYAVMCAHHDYAPKETVKMDGQLQHTYPRKNWSSMMLINCGHPSNSVLTKEVVNDIEKPGAYFHRFSWLADEKIGKLSHEWNWLVGWYQEPKDGSPKFLHYTEGGPWFETYQNCEYNYEWYKIQAEYLNKTVLYYQNKSVYYQNKLQYTNDRIVDINDLSLSDQKKNLLTLTLQNLIDPDEGVYKTKKEIKRLKEESMGVKVAAISPSKEDYNLEAKGLMYDPYLQDFVLGAGGRILEWNYKNLDDTTLVIRGLGGKSQKAIKHCMENNRDFYAIDTGYLQPNTKKEYHRITFNGLQNTGPLIPRDDLRLRKLNFIPGEFKTGRKILVCPPSEKVMKFYGKNLSEWMDSTLAEIKAHTDRPIEIRLKPSRTERVTDNTIWQALSDDVYCLITYNSIAATEAFLFGVPAIALAPNAASAVCNTNINEINNLNNPTRELQMILARHLSYCQFTAKELRDGTAWRILNESRELLS
jgi:lipopolysaccharide biosynthesis glycosyltransferase